MSTRTRLSLYMLAGIFLAYEGFKLIKEIMSDRPDNATMFLVVGAVFLVGGVALFVKAVMDYIKGGYYFPDDPDEETDGSESESVSGDEAAEEEKTENSETGEE